MSDHFDGKKFHNLEIKDDLKSFWKFLKWQWESSPKKWPQNVANNNYQLPKLESGNKAIMSFINHASFLVQLPGLNILTDPIYSSRASPLRWLGPPRVRPPGIAFEALPTVDVVLISHNHYDHLDLKTLKQLDAKYHPLFLVPLGNEKWLKSEGLLNVMELDWWQEFRIKDTRFIFTPAQHWSARSLFDKNETLWGSFFVDTGAFSFYFAGDTGYAGHFKQIKNRLGAPDVSLLPIGGYEPRWFMRAHHLNPQEALLAHLDLGATLSVGMHFGTFQLTDEGIDDPLLAMVEARERLALSADKFVVLDQGESKIFSNLER